MSITENFSVSAAALCGLFVFGAEPRSLRELGAGRSAVNKDGGDRGWFWLSWARHWLISLELRRTPEGSDGEREQTRDAITMVCVLRSYRAPRFSATGPCGTQTLSGSATAANGGSGDGVGEPTDRPQYYRTIIVLRCQVYLELAGFNLHNVMLYNLNDVFRSTVVHLCPGAFSLSDGPRSRLGTPAGIACERLRGPA